MLEKATSPVLRAGLEAHIAETEGQIDVLKRVFESLGMKAKRIKCDVAEGLVEESEKMMEEARNRPAILDVVIGSAIAKVEHDEIASYRGLVAIAKETERDEAVELLLRNLGQEEETASKAEAAMPALLRSALSAQAASV